VALGARRPRNFKFIAHTTKLHANSTGPGPPYAVSTSPGPSYRPEHLQNWSKEHLVYCYCRLTCHTAASSLVRWASATLLISQMTASRSEYHCSSLWRPALQRLPHLLSSTSINRWPYRPTVHSRQSASNVLTAQHIRCFGGSRSSYSRSCCSCGCCAS
jgi:hypothetical protein